MKTKQSQNMLHKLILFFVYKTKGQITKTQLVKFLYLADLYSVKWTGEQLTELDWCYYLRGPWNEEIDKALEDLNKKKVSFQTSSQRTQLIGISSNANPEEDLELPYSLTLMLENIRKEWAGSGQEKFQELMNYVYSTAPMQAAQENHHSEDKAPLNLHLEMEQLKNQLED